MRIARVGFEEIFDTAMNKLNAIDEEIEAKVAKFRADLEEEANHDKSILDGVILSVSEEAPEEEEVEECECEAEVESVAEAEEAVAEEAEAVEEAIANTDVSEEVQQEIATFQA